MQQPSTAALPPSYRPTRRPGSAVWSPPWWTAGLLAAFFVARTPELVPLVSRIKLLPITFLIAGLVALSRATPASWQRLGRSRIIRAIVPYVSIAVLSIPLAASRRDGFDQLLTLPFAAILLFVFGLIDGRRSYVDRLLWSFLLATTLTGVGWLFAGSMEGGRLGASGSYDPNDLASVLSMAVPVGIGLGTRGGKLARVVAFGCVVACAMLVTQTGSRGGLLALLAGVGVMLGSLRPRRLVQAIPVVALSGVLLWSFGPEVFRERAKTLLTVQEDYNTTSQGGRLAIWKRGLKLGVTHPVLGVGLGSFAYADFQQYASENPTYGWYTAHNMWVQAFAELGLFGVALLGVVTHACVRPAVRLYRRAPGLPRLPELLGAVVAFLTGAFFLSHAWHPLLFGCCAIGLIAERIIEQAAPTRSLRMSGVRG